MLICGIESFLAPCRESAECFGGLPDNFTAMLRNATGSATHLRFAIYPPESITTDEDAPAAGGSNCPNLPSTFDTPAHDTGEITLGSFAAPAGGRQSWGEAKCEAGDADCCADGTRVGPAQEPCSGSYRHFSGQDFGSSGDWSWTCP